MTDLGTVTPCYSVRFERSSAQSVARLWRAITDSAEVSAWMTYPARIDLRVGGDYFVDFARTDGGRLDGVIVKLEPGRVLHYAWGTSVVEWQVEPDGDGGRYVFAHYGLEDRGLSDEEGLLAGWHAWLDDFDRFVEGREALPHAEREAAWVSLGRAYRPILSEVLGGLKSDSVATSPSPATDRA